MKWLLVFLTLISTSFVVSAQNAPAKHPRVMELEDKLIEETSLYFSRRYPNEPFFVKIEVNPLRRSLSQGAMSDSLPYFDQDSEELVDEWDDPTTPLSFLRNRINKITVSVSVPDDFDDLKLADIKQELPVYLKLYPSRDEIILEKKIKHNSPATPQYIYYILGALIISSLVIGFMFRWSVSKMKTPGASAQAGAMPAPMGESFSANSSKPRSSSSKVATAVSGDVTFHDPIKTLDIVRTKVKQIEETNTFPTLKDLILLSEFSMQDSSTLGAIIYELPTEWQKTLFKMGRDQKWLETFSNPGQINHEGLMLLDRMSKQRSFIAGDRLWEDLLIQIWRLGDKSATFFKKINADHAFIILGMLPKSLSLGVAKKCFPGAWGKLLDTKSQNVVIDPKIVKDYLAQALEIVPSFDWKILDEYKKDKEILTYLDKVSIEDERDIYETISKDSFIFDVRPPFYKVFDLENEDIHKIVQSFGLDQWALAVVNSSRNYIKAVSEQLDEKKKIIFSSHLKNFDHNPPSPGEQGLCRQMIALHAETAFFSKENLNKNDNSVQNGEDLNEKSA